MHGIETGTLPDLRVRFLSASRWQVAPVSVRARGWFADHGLDPSTAERPILETDLDQVNRLAASARQNGFRIEFNGPLAVVRL